MIARLEPIALSAARDHRDFWRRNPLGLAPWPTKPTLTVFQATQAPSGSLKRCMTRFIACPGMNERPTGGVLKETDL